MMRKIYMEYEEVRNKTKKILEICGFEINGDNWSIENMNEMDSILYISTLVELENNFNIEFPEYVLQNNILESMEGLCNLIYDSVNKN